jgi:hypothetical protein
MDTRNILLSEGVFSFRYSHLCARNKICAIRECVYQVRVTVTCRSGIVGDIVVGPSVLPDGFVFQDRRDFLEIRRLGLIEDAPLPVWLGLRFSADDLQYYVRKFLVVIQSDTSCTYKMSMVLSVDTLRHMM